jgi:hypothetical protein
MGKKRGLKNRWLAFVPFVNIYFLGKLTGDCDVFGHKLKNTWLYVLVSQVLMVLLTAGIIFTEIYLYLHEGKPLQTEFGVTYWSPKTKATQTALKVNEILSYIAPIIQLAYEVFLFILVLGLLKQYAPKNYLFLGFVVLFVPISRYIVIFVLRNREAIDYEAYMRARHEAYMRAQQARYGNPYGNPYNNPYGNPYGNPYNNPYGNPNQNAQKPPEEPFSEFGSANEDKSSADEDVPFGERETGSTGDGFFD